jgi:hypothetical protein
MFGRMLLLVGGLLPLAGCPASAPSDGGPSPGNPCDLPGTICTVAGTGQSLFNGDMKGALQTALYYPLDVDFDPLGRPLIVDWNNLRIRRINDDGTVETVAGQDYEAAPTDGARAIDTPLHHPSDLEQDARGVYYLAGNHVPLVYIIDATERVYVVAGNGDYGNDGDGGPALHARLDVPYGVFPTGDGGFYFTDEAQHVVRYVDPAGIIHTVAGSGTRGYSGDGGPGSAAQLANPTRLRRDAAGGLFICDTGNHCIRRLDRSGVITTVVGTGRVGYDGDGGPAALARLNSPYDLAFAPSGDLYVADTGNNVIRRIGRDGIIRTVVGTGAPGFAGDGDRAEACQLNRPSGIKFGADGALWISDTYNHRVRKIAGFLATQP